MSTNIYKYSFIIIIYLGVGGFNNIKTEVPFPTCINQTENLKGTYHENIKC